MADLRSSTKGQVTRSPARWPSFSSQLNLGGNLPCPPRLGQTSLGYVPMAPSTSYSQPYNNYVINSYIFKVYVHNPISSMESRPRSLSAHQYLSLVLCPVSGTQQACKYLDNESYQGSWAGMSNGKKRLCAAGCVYVQITHKLEVYDSGQPRQAYNSFCPRKINLPQLYHSANKG